MNLAPVALRPNPWLRNVGCPNGLRYKSHLRWTKLTNHPNCTATVFRHTQLAPFCFPLFWPRGRDSMHQRQALWFDANWNFIFYQQLVHGFGAPVHAYFSRRWWFVANWVDLIPISPLASPDFSVKYIHISWVFSVDHQHKQHTMNKTWSYINTPSFHLFCSIWINLVNYFKLFPSFDPSFEIFWSPEGGLPQGLGIPRQLGAFQQEGPHLKCGGSFNGKTRWKRVVSWDTILDTSSKLS